MSEHDGEMTIYHMAHDIALAYLGRDTAIDANITVGEFVNRYKQIVAAVYECLAKDNEPTYKNPNGG